MGLQVHIPFAVDTSDARAWHRDARTPIGLGNPTITYAGDLLAGTDDDDPDRLIKKASKLI
eukprot:3577352-Lingulodinium_polyedra.AAC.1